MTIRRTPAHHINPDQLRMLIPAHEFVESGKYDSVDLGSSVKPHNWQGKVDDVLSVERGRKYGYEGTLLDDVRQHGVERPVSVAWYPKARYWEADRPEIGQGHHRIAASYIIDRNTEVPVINHSNADGRYSHVRGGDGSDFGDDTYERDNPRVRQPWQ